MRTYIGGIVLIALAGAACFHQNLSAATPSAQDTYKAKCAGCHAADGSGDTKLGKSMKLRDLRSAETQKDTDAAWVAVIKNGKKPMPAYGKTLDDAQVQDLIAYLRGMAKK